MLDDVTAISRQFRIDGELVGARPCAGGHINDSYVATYEHAGKRTRYFHQKINDLVFGDPAALMNNIQRVTDHVRATLVAEGVPHVLRRTLTVIPARDGAPYVCTAEGQFWRTYRFIERTRTFQVVERPSQAYEAAKTFGRFQVLLRDLPGPRLTETVKDFDNAPKRLEAFDRAVEADPYNRAHGAENEIDFVSKHREMAGVLIGLRKRGEVPERITHNDTKLNNVLFDEATHEGLCVVDLDTVMPGLSLRDFGDMVRTMTSTSLEDETTLSRVHLRMEPFEALARGYLDAAGHALNATEKEHLVFAGKLITFEQGVRFLTDYLCGDAYYKTSRNTHNLDRCRTQFKLVESILQQEEALNRFIRSL